MMKLIFVTTALILNCAAHATETIRHGSLDFADMGLNSSNENLEREYRNERNQLRRLSEGGPTDQEALAMTPTDRAITQRNGYVEQMDVYIPGFIIPFGDPQWIRPVFRVVENRDFSIANDWIRSHRNDVGETRVVDGYEVYERNYDRNGESALVTIGYVNPVERQVRIDFEWTEKQVFLLRSQEKGMCIVTAIRRGVNIYDVSQGVSAVCSE